jgi:hypothetical protein
MGTKGTYEVSGCPGTRVTGKASYLKLVKGGMTKVPYFSHQVAIFGITWQRLHRFLQGFLHPEDPTEFYHSFKFQGGSNLSWPLGGASKLQEIAQAS